MWYVVPKYILYVLVKMVLLLTTPIANLIIPLFYRAQEEGLDKYTWGGVWGTFDNPIQGDRGWVTKRSPFPNVTTGWKGYINRVGWMNRNRLYGLARILSEYWEDGYTMDSKGNPDISDKHKVPGTYSGRVYNAKGKLVVFEYYAVLPYKLPGQTEPTQNLRIRLGWKAKSRKVEESGIMQFVFTINPFDSYGDD